ncbi:MAG: tol-pal system protein YbgF [Pseudomonadota bacterium]
MAQEVIKGDDLQTRIDRLETDLIILQKNIYKNINNSNQQSNNRKNIAHSSSLVIKLQQVEQQLANILGRVENLEYQIGTLANSLEKIDQELSKINSLTLNNSTTTNADISNNSNSINNIDNNNLADSIAGNNNRLINQERINNNSNATINDINKNQDKLNNLANDNALGEKENAVQVNNNAEAEKNILAINTPVYLYNKAYAELSAKNYSDAQKIFEEFIKTYPNNTLTANAYYWLGEIYFSYENYKKAAEFFLDTHTKFPNSNKLIDSLYKLGLALLKLDKAQEACKIFNKITNEHDIIPSYIVSKIEQQKTNCANL